MKEPLVKELSPLAQDLVRAARGATDPTAADQARVHAALQQRLASPPADPPGADPSAVARPLAHKVAAGVVGAGLIAGALMFALGEGSSEAPVPSPQPVEPPAEIEPASPSVGEEPPAEVPPEPEAPTAPTVASPAPSASRKSPSVASAPSTDKERAAGTLAQEVELLSKATNALNAGRAAEALQVLGEHQRKFPRGVLSQERRAARAQALCRLGRVAEARTELQRLPQSSPQAARVRQVCGFEQGE